MNYPRDFFKFSRALTPMSSSWVSKKEIMGRLKRCSEDILRGKDTSGEKLGKVSSISSGDSKVFVIDWGNNEYEMVVAKGYRSLDCDKLSLKDFAFQDTGEQK